jgi:predicted ArsR family transcriptional regulator
MMMADELSGSKRKLLEQLKISGPLTANALARALELTDVAVRQHLQALEEGGFVRQRRLEPRGRGRPSVEWSLAPRSNGMFPDHHADLTVELIRAARAAFGEDGLDRLIAERARAQTRSYRADPGMASKSLGVRVKALARRRTAEGYMAEALREKDGAWMLIERHCPICEAAKTCVGLCKAELQVFRHALGDDVTVERTQHLLAGSDRCAYRIRKNLLKGG